MKSQMKKDQQTKPILLYDGGCHVCRNIAHWVEMSAQSQSGEKSIILMPVGDDPEALKLLNPDLNIWDAYASNYLILPDGSMKKGGEAIAEVFRILPNTKWFAGCFGLSIFGFRPFQLILNFSYAILDDIRPLLGCESCGHHSIWIGPLAAISKWMSSIFGGELKASSALKITARKSSPRRMPAKPE